MSPFLLAVTLGAAFVAALACTPWIIRRADAWGLHDRPCAVRRVHVQPVPRLGGIAVFCAMAVGLAAASLAGAGELFASERLYAGLLAGAVILLATGVVDDVRGLSPRVKLCGQVAAALVVYAAGFRVEVFGWGTAQGMTLGWISLPVTVLWIVGVTNAFNLIDGLDGLATGIGVVGLASSSAIAMALAPDGLLLVSVAVLGALLGFLRFNFNPARIFLGDSGSLFVGFILAVHSVHSSMKSATALLVLVPLFTLAIPLLDTVLAIGRRWLRGVPFTAADRRHIHHRLLETGLTQRRAVLVLYVAATALASVGLLLAFAPPPHLALIAGVGTALSLALLLAGLTRLDYHEFYEAGAALATAPVKLRRVIRDRIYARDVAAVLRVAETIDEVNATLEDSVENFGFLHMELCPEGARGPAGTRKLGRRIWKLEYPVCTEHDDEQELLVFRIWCDVGAGFRPYGAERVARILAPALETHVSARGATSVQAPAEERVETAGRSSDCVTWQHGLGRSSALG
jgi:UDP-GlcNAc:undecaprenyl-phosphate GlcNAc-1-phosphate transferase